MCGICGIWGKSEDRILDAMVASMHHRGPDDRGFFREDGIALGMTRLAILDISPAGHQPMSTPDGTIWIVYNGETYNYRQERDILMKKGYTFHSGSDTEVVLRMYEAYGDDFVKRMRGMFALAVYDKRRGPGHTRLIIARDQLGIKPLLYAPLRKPVHLCVRNEGHSCKLARREAVRFRSLAPSHNPRLHIPTPYCCFRGADAYARPSHDHRTGERKDRKILAARHQQDA